MLAAVSPVVAQADTPTAKQVVAGVVAHYVEAQRFSADCQVSRTSKAGPQTTSHTMTVFIDRAGMLRTDRPVAGGSIKTFSLVPDPRRGRQTRNQVIEIVPSDPTTTIGIGDERITHKNQRVFAWLPFVFFDDQVRMPRLKARLDTSGTYGDKGDLVVRLALKQPAGWTLHLVVDAGDFRVKQAVTSEPTALLGSVRTIYSLTNEKLDGSFAADTFDLKAASRNVSHDSSDDYRAN